MLRIKLNYDGLVVSDALVMNAISDKYSSAKATDVEKQVLKEISQHHSLVIATGGGLVTLPENWGILHQGLLVLLVHSQKE